MYFSYSRSRNPTNRECRVASILSITGFIASGWEVLHPPNSFLPFLGELSLIIFLSWLGLATLLRARPQQGLLWPQFTARFGSGRQHPPLDERDTLVRYRTFLTSYQILSVLIWVIVIVPGLLGSRINVLTERYHGPLELGLLTLSLLMVLTWLLPHWVVPWLESNATFDAESDLEPSPSPSGTPERAATAESSNWIRTLWKLSNWVVWGVVLVVILWISRSHVPGGLRALFR
jgi:hypothetical protein